MIAGGEITINMKPNSTAALRFFRYLVQERGYKRFRPKNRNNRIAASELAMHCKIVDKRVRFGVISQHGYAHVLLDDGLYADGIWHEDSAGNVSLT